MTSSPANPPTSARLAPRPPAAPSPAVPPEPTSSAHPSEYSARAVVEALVADGVRDVVLCPGSRSAPLAYALAEAEAAGLLHLRVVVDERSAAFQALGMARAALLLEGRRRPAAVVTTSGTAVANLHPAVAEADAAGVPLVLVTADRPHEMVGTGANQTTEQAGLFGPALRALVDLPADLPRDLGEDAARTAITGQVRRAVAAADGRLSDDPGPVQVNVRLRPPLVPGAPARRRREPQIGSGPVERCAMTSSAQAAGFGESVHRSRRASARGVVVAGDQSDPALGAAATALAEALHWPLLAEPTSLARSGPCAVVPSGTALAGEPGAQTEAVVVVGHPTLTRPVGALLARTDLDLTVVADRSRWTDVAGTATRILPARTLMAALAAGTLPDGVPGPGPKGWLDAWHEAAHQAPGCRRPAERGAPGSAEPLTAEAAAVAVWSSCLPSDGEPRSASVPPLLVVGSSMTVRRLDAAAPAGPRPPLAVANRGLAGIDGTVSTGVGLAAASGRPVRVLLGDLALLHDVTGLARGAREAEVDLQVIVLDDGGGAIFAELEYRTAEPRAWFDRFFATPQTVDLPAVAAALGARVHRVTEVAQLRTVLRMPVAGRSLVHVDLRRGPRAAVGFQASPRQGSEQAQPGSVTCDHQAKDVRPRRYQ